MKLLEKYLLAICVVVCIVIFKPSCAVAVIDTSLTSGMVSHFLAKLLKIPEYVDEIKETVQLRNTFGKLDINKAAEMLSGQKGNVESFLKDSLKFDKSPTSMGDTTVFFGAPQASKDKAIKYVRDTFFAYKEGGDYMGPLTNDAGIATAQKNRENYKKQISSMGYAQAVEALTKNREESLSALKNVKKEVSRAKTYDEKKAAEALIIQTEIQERMRRLSLELSTLEQDAVFALNEEPVVYIVPYTAEEIQQQTDKQMQDIDFSK